MLTSPFTQSRKSGTDESWDTSAMTPRQVIDDSNNNSTRVEHNEFRPCDSLLAGVKRKYNDGYNDVDIGGDGCNANDGSDDDHDHNIADHGDDDHDNALRPIVAAIAVPVMMMLLADQDEADEDDYYARRHLLMLLLHESA
jgi:hypothetical protein